MAVLYYKYMRMSRNRIYSQGIQGHPQTKQRQLLLELIREAKGHIDAKELFRLAADKDSSISPATVYRSLNLFKEIGLIDQKRLGRAQCYYELKRSSQHQHLVCSRCGKVIDFACPLSEMIEKVRQDHRFVVTKAEVYLEGYCAECADEKDKGEHSRSDSLSGLLQMSPGKMRKGNL
jgi:Fur family transcriptional regulator, ferric uptake regulator